MYLKEIRAENFKSFGKSVRIPFTQGYTCVTGPNGCGKSNIFDAVLFVLGPKSSKAVRAKKLTDLIFNGGTDKKKGSNFCEVSLIFENKDRLIPIDSEEVKLTRYVRLSDTTPEGYNSYFYINDKKSSLTEFDAVLANARISADGYNFVQQGDAARLAKISDIERRKILEDIAGITKFDEDIGKAEVKKTDVESNLERIRIIMEEIKTNLQQLEKDREGALKRRELEQKLSLCKAQLAWKNKSRTEDELKMVTETIKKCEDDLKDMETKKNEFAERLKDTIEKLNKVENELVKRGGEEAKELKAKIDDLRIKEYKAKDSVENCKTNLRILSSEETELKGEITKLKKELSGLAPKRSELEKKVAEKSGLLSQKENELKESQNHLAKSDTEVAGVQREILVLRKNIEQKEQELGELKIECDRSRDQFQRLQNELAEIEEKRTSADREIADSDFVLNNLKSSIKTTEKGLKQLQEEYNKTKSEETKLIQYIQELEIIVREKTVKYETLKAEAKAAESVQKGYSTAVDAILEARDRGLLKGIRGTIAELATVSKEYETALNIAAGSRMQSIVVDDDEVAAKAIMYLKQKKIGRATFLPMNKMIEVKPRGKALMVAQDSNSLGFAIDLIKFKEEYHSAFSYVLGDTIIIKDLNSARTQMGGVRLVTLDGELFEASGAMVGGAIGKSLLSFGVPTQNEISKIGAELANASEELDKTGKSLQKVREHLRELETRLNETSGKTDVSGMKAEELEKKKNECHSISEKVNTELKRKNSELEECQKNLTSFEKKRDACESSLTEFRKKKEIVEKKGVDILPERLQTKIIEMTQAVSNLKEEVTKLDFDRQTFDQQMGNIDQRCKEFSGKLTKNESDVKENKKTMDKNQKDWENFREELEVLQQTQAGTEGKMKGLYDEKLQLIQEKTALEGENKQSDEKLEVKKDDLLSNQMRLKNTENSLAEIMVEVQGYKLETTEKLPSFEYLKTTIPECERQIQSMGDVNMKALDDYDIQKKRADELKDETERLDNEKKDLITLVNELTEKKKDGLYKVFNPINENLKEVYSKLSSGGYAELVMENPEEPFKGGIIMKVKPHDKKMISILSLSGGEQSLAALSFINAIQRYDPSPFYVLDEVDQNLDAINTERAAKYLSASAKGAQFIQISLRKATLKEANNIIGVTIQKNGISDVVMKINLTEVNDKGEIAGHPSIHLGSHESNHDQVEDLTNAATDLANHLNNGVDV